MRSILKAAYTPKPKHSLPHQQPCTAPSCLPAAPVNAATHGLEVAHRQWWEVAQPVARVGKLQGG